MQLVLSPGFPKGYIGHQCWRELERVINIEKESGFRRTRSEANRNRALTEYLPLVLNPVSGARSSAGARAPIGNGKTYARSGSPYRSLPPRTLRARAASVATLWPRSAAYRRPSLS